MQDGAKGAAPCPSRVSARRERPSERGPVQGPEPPRPSAGRQPVVQTGGATFRSPQKTAGLKEAKDVTASLARPLPSRQAHSERGRENFRARNSRGRGWRPNRRHVLTRRRVGNAKGSVKDRTRMSRLPGIQAGVDPNNRLHARRAIRKKGRRESAAGGEVEARV